MRRLLPILLTLLLLCGARTAAQEAQADSTARFAPLDSLLTQFYGALLPADNDEKSASTSRSPSSTTTASAA